MRKSVISFFCLTLLMSAGCNQKSPALRVTVPVVGRVYNQRIKIGRQTLDIQIVASPADMAKGLSGRASMLDNQGMLFDFGTGTNPGFWMPDMKFDLDLIWINNLKVIYVTRKVPAPASPSAKLKIYYPPAPVDWVLEVNAGWTDRNKIKIGDDVKLVGQN